MMTTTPLMSSRVALLTQQTAEGKATIFRKQVLVAAATYVSVSGASSQLQCRQEASKKTPDVVAANVIGYSTVLGMPPPSIGTVGLTMALESATYETIYGTSSHFCIVDDQREMLCQSQLLLGMEPLAAVQHSRIYHTLIPNQVLYENWTLVDGEHIELAEGTCSESSCRWGCLPTRCS
ncbi:hypothetical protein H6P81_002780 [Aristolochia fimbriata]|uniref:Uncharacterized protein n=1 Tax=Aristolochia fimbriata TaxID=158543 RepID=A0AAV7FAP6_ARIFI|nr:hypothetical protein H6P81_002780 [Aristolochia fimbriata]